MTNIKQDIVAKTWAAFEKRRTKETLYTHLNSIDVNYLKIHGVKRKVNFIDRLFGWSYKCNKCGSTHCYYKFLVIPKSAYRFHIHGCGDCGHVYYQPYIPDY